ncbi:hypothetical protein [Bifidobacterium myosotis]|uniref:Uncharacterized protein n=1 Tax=Bifidobacterium myosotis TaxID=1630166 RepID=A0A5M9ZI95_9BIFI|nr:hypothetical protein [Bifidobacterium myosotis]KAA8827195.1 hypothetical protein EMO91_09080 [Bifidobacterium myosotis]
MSVVNAGTKGYNFKYADLATLMNHVNKELHVNVRFRSDRDGDMWTQSTVICDENWNETTPPLCEMPVIVVVKKGMTQDDAFYAGVTKARRYSLMGALGIAATEDVELLSNSLKRDTGELSSDSEAKHRVDGILNELAIPKGRESQFISERLRQNVDYAHLTEAQARRFIEWHEQWKKSQTKQTSKENTNE